MRKWKYDVTLGALNQMIYRHTHDLDGYECEVKGVEKHLVDECKKLRDLLVRAYQE